MCIRDSHFNGGDGGFESFVAGLQSGAVQRLLQRFAGQDAEGMRHACLLLGLAKAAGDFVVDGFIVGGLAAVSYTHLLSPGPGSLGRG